MSLLASVSPTINVTVALPSYILTVGMVEEGTTNMVQGTVIVDGTRYSDVYWKDLVLKEGVHTFNVEFPAVYAFINWQITDAMGGIISEPTGRPLSWNVVEHISIWAILRLIPIATALTISVPTTVEPSASITFIGKLTRPDTGVGIGGKTIPLEHPPGTAVTSTSTDSNGNYSITVTAPALEGTYKYRTSFAGTAGLGKAASRVLGIGVGVPFDPIWIIGSMLTGALMIGASLLMPTR